MNNVVKLFSINKDFRIAVVDTSILAKEQLKDFRGTDVIRCFLEKIIVNFTLLSAIDDNNTKISINIHLNNNMSVFCQISNNLFEMFYSDSLNEFNGKVSDLFSEKTSLSITKGDWNTGLHTGSVDAYIDSADMLFSHFTFQSDQLPSNFISLQNRGVLVQPLPFCDEHNFAVANREVAYLLRALENSDWLNVDFIYRDIAVKISESQISNLPIYY